MDFIRPCNTKNISDNYAAHIRRGSGLPGTDFTCRVGEAVVAVADGVVTRANNFGASGNNVRIHHKNGFTSYYLHLSKIRVKNGDVVKQGQLIGLSGGKKGAPGSGSSTGPHLHFSLANPSGKLVDPEEFIGKQSAAKPTVVRKTVRLGSIGSDVRYLQRRLGILADGIFGPGTRSAVVKFQKSRRIVADGVVGPKTWAIIG
jgi:hypothetical protein